MPPRRTFQLKPMPGAAVRGGIGIAGLLLALAGLLDWLPGASTVLRAITPGLFMVLVLASGLRIASAASLLLIAAATILLDMDAALRSGIMSLAPVACGEALRRGISPLYLCAPLLAAMLADDLPGFTTAPLSWPSLARAVVESGACVALAALAFLAIPRRSFALPRHARPRLDHLSFTALVGLVALSGTILLNLPRGGIAQPTLGAALAPTLAAATLLAMLAGALVAWKGRAASASALEARMAGRRRGSKALPLELQQAVVALRRRSTSTQRQLKLIGSQLKHLRLSAASRADELQRTQAALQQRTVELRQNIAAGALMRARYDALMDGIPAAAIFTGPDGQVQAANHMALSLLGHEAGQLQGQPIGVLVPDSHILDHPLARGESGELAPTRRVLTCSVRQRDGRLRELAVQVLAFAAGPQAHRLVLLREADTAKRAMAALDKARAVTDSMRQSRDMFIATMSHEMRTPLHGLIATLDMLRTSEAMRDVHDQLTIARGSARALLKIANDVLDFTRIGSGQFTLDQSPFSMMRVLREVVEEAQAHAATQGLSLALDMRAQLPPAFVGDASRLKQILGNLVSNALKFTHEGGVRLEVSCDGRQTCIDVIDSGEGVPPENRDRIFEPFVQAHSRSRSQVGTGLGLPISRRLAEAMGGDLTLLRTGPEGTVFRLTLQLEASDEQPPEDQSQRVFRNPRGRILVVEDNAANRYVAQALLNGLECPATIVEDGNQALELLRNNEEFDLILMDCQMPGIDGFETTRRARRILTRHIPIIAMTANAMANDRKDCMDAGMDDFLPKPFDRRALNDILCKWLDPAKTTDDPRDIERKLTQLPDLDAAVLNELCESLQWRVAPLKQIHATFNESLRPTIQLLRTGGPAERVIIQRHLHTLLGSSGMVGARQIEQLAGRLRHAIHDQKYDQLEPFAQDLERAMARYNRAFDIWLENAGDQTRQVKTLRVVNDRDIT